MGAADIQLANLIKQEADRLAALKKQEASEIGIGKVVKDCDVCTEMEVIPAGDFSM